MNKRYIAKTVCVSILSMALIFFVTGCQNDLDAKKDPFFEKWKLEAAKSEGTSPTARVRSADILEEELFKGEELGAERALPKTRVTLKMRNAPIDVVLKALTRAAKQNILIKSDVKGEISVDFRDVPWNEAFESIMRSKMLTYVWEGSIIRIASIEDLENDLKLDSIRDKKMELETRKRQMSTLHTVVIPIDYITVGKAGGDAASAAGMQEMKANIESFLTKDEKGNPHGSVRVSNHSNSLIVQATRDDLKKIIPVIDQLDKPMKQIKIEANIVEATSETARNLGVQWGGLYHGTSGSKNYWVTPGSNTGDAMGNSVNSGLDPLTGMALNFPALLGSETTLGQGNTGMTLGYISEKVGSYVLNVQLSALQQAGKLNILSSPSITTLDNQMAYTENGEKIPYVTIDEDGERTVKFEDAVLRLEITPHVIDDEHMKMDIKVKKDEVDFSRKVDENPVIIKKETNTSLIVKNGDTIVISGLSKQKSVNADSGAPWLMDIPILGYLFKSEAKSKSLEEVLIFITPHILGYETAANVPAAAN